MKIRPMLRQCAKSVAVLLATLLFVAAAENHVFGYLWRSAELVVFDKNKDNGRDPQMVLEASTSGRDAPITILAVGDIVDCPEPSGYARDIKSIRSWFGLNAPFERSEVPAAETVDLSLTWSNAPIIALGDIVYRRGTPDEFMDCFDPIWGPLKDRTLPIPGNHEYYTPGAFPYYDYWGRQTGPDRRGYYAIATNDWLLVALNSEIDAGPDAAQTLWLHNVLESSQSPCILAFFHRPAFASQERSDHGAARDLFRTLSAYDVDVVLNGHNHYYERLRPLDGEGQMVSEGITTIVVGTGGRKPKTGIQQRPFSETLIQGRLGMLELTLGKGRYTTAFHAVGEDAPLDPTTATCRGT